MEEIVPPNRLTVQIPENAEILQPVKGGRVSICDLYLTPHPPIIKCCPFSSLLESPFDPTLAMKFSKINIVGNVAKAKQKPLHHGLGFNVDEQYAELLAHQKEISATLRSRFNYTIQEKVSNSSENLPWVVLNRELNQVSVRLRDSEKINFKFGVNVSANIQKLSDRVIAKVVDRPKQGKFNCLFNAAYIQHNGRYWNNPYFQPKPGKPPVVFPVKNMKIPRLHAVVSLTRIDDEKKKPAPSSAIQPTSSSKRKVDIFSAAKVKIAKKNTDEPIRVSSKLKKPSVFHPLPPTMIKLIPAPGIDPELKKKEVKMPVVFPAPKIKIPKTKNNAKSVAGKQSAASLQNREPRKEIVTPRSMPLLLDQPMPKKTVKVKPSSSPEFVIDESDKLSYCSSTSESSLFSSISGSEDNPPVSRLNLSEDDADLLDIYAGDASDLFVGLG